MAYTTVETDKPGWPSRRDAKPIDPQNYAGINYGYVVKVTTGENKGKMGLAVMFSRFGDVGVSQDLPDAPQRLIGYSFREFPGNLEILAREPLTKKEFQNLSQIS